MQDRTYIPWSYLIPMKGLIDFSLHKSTTIHNYRKDIIYLSNHILTKHYNFNFRTLHHNSLYLLSYFDSSTNISVKYIIHLFFSHYVLPPHQLIAVAELNPSPSHDKPNTSWAESCPKFGLLFVCLLVQ